MNMAMTGETKGNEVGKLIGFLKVLYAEFIEWHNVMTLQLRMVSRGFATRLASKTISLASSLTLFTPIASVVRNAVASSFGIAHCREKAIKAAINSMALRIRNHEGFATLLTYQLDGGRASQMLGFEEAFSRTINLPIRYRWIRLCRHFKGVETTGKGANLDGSWFGVETTHTGTGTKAVVAGIFDGGLATHTDLVHGSSLWELPYFAWGNKAVGIAAGSGATLVP